MRVLCRKVAELSQGQEIKLSNDTAYNVRVHGVDQQYPQNNTNGWMDYEFTITVGDKETMAIERYFESCTSLTEIRNIPPLYFPSPPAPIPEGAGVNINGEYFENDKKDKRVKLAPEVKAAREKGFSVNSYVSPRGSVSVKPETKAARPTVPPKQVVVTKPLVTATRNTKSRVPRLNPRRRKAQQQRSAQNSRSTSPTQETTKQTNAVTGEKEGKSSRNTSEKWRKLRKSQ